MLPLSFRPWLLARENMVKLQGPEVLSVFNFPWSQAWEWHPLHSIPVVVGTQESGLFSLLLHSGFLWLNLVFAIITDNTSLAFIFSVNLGMRLKEGSERFRINWGITEVTIQFKTSGRTLQSLKHLQSRIGGQLINMQFHSFICGHSHWSESFINIFKFY